MLEEIRKLLEERSSELGRRKSRELGRNEAERKWEKVREEGLLKLIKLKPMIFPMHAW